MGQVVVRHLERVARALRVPVEAEQRQGRGQSVGRDGVQLVLAEVERRQIGQRAERAGLDERHAAALQDQSGQHRHLERGEQGVREEKEEVAGQVERHDRSGRVANKAVGQSLEQTVRPESDLQLVRGKMEGRLFGVVHQKRVVEQVHVAQMLQRLKGL